LLNDVLGLEIRKPPSDSTFRYLFLQLDVEAFEALLLQWMSQQLALVDGVDTLVCDGKTLRGSIDQKPAAAATFIAQVSLYSQALGVAIAQTTYATDESSETAALQRLLSGIELSDVLVQADALHGNHPFSLPCGAGRRLLDCHQRQSTKSFSTDPRSLTYAKRVPFQASDAERGHGRESTWTLRAMESPEWIKKIWPGSALIIAVQSVGKGEGRPIEESRYYVFAERTYRCDTSLRTTANALLQHVRYRWSIENSWHWVRDTQLREDAHRYRECNGVQVLAGLRTVALNLLRLMCWHGQRGPQTASA